MNSGPGMLPDVLCMNTTTTLIYHDLQDGGVTIKNAVSRWNLYLIPLRSRRLANQ
jgi:hypothetical protein